MAQIHREWGAARRGIRPPAPLPQPAKPPGLGSDRERVLTPARQGGPAPLPRLLLGPCAATCARPGRGQPRSLLRRCPGTGRERLGQRGRSGAAGGQPGQRSGHGQAQQAGGAGRGEAQVGPGLSCGKGPAAGGTGGAAGRGSWQEFLEQNRALPSFYPFFYPRSGRCGEVAGGKHRSRVGNRDFKAKCLSASPAAQREVFSVSLFGAVRKS